jgi:2-polyprenyl-6-methoxyphenol hydroxylase-like FAD-dependent oxidoreductase
MELLRSWGLEDEIKAGGMPRVEWMALVTEKLTDADRGELATLGLPNKEQAAVLSPTAPLCAPQHHTEAVLLAHAQSIGVDVAFGQEVLRVDMAEEGAEALIRYGDSTRAVSARYIIGADGARSIVRSALGIDMVGPGEIDTVLVSVAFSARLWDLVGQRRYGLYPIVRPDMSSVLVPSGVGDHWVFGIGQEFVGSMEAPGDDPPDPRRRRRAPPSAPDRPDPDVQVRRRDRATVWFRARVPDRRRGAPRNPARRHRHEHSDRRRARSRVEARLGAEGLGGRGAARNI